MNFTERRNALRTAAIASDETATQSAGAPNPACRLDKSTVGPGDEVGPAAFDAGAPNAACRLDESTVGPGDEVGPAALDAGARLRSSWPLPLKA